MEGQTQQQRFEVGICDVEDVLVQLVRAGLPVIEPQAATAGRLAELLAFGITKQRNGETECFLAALASDEVNACHDVAPLVTAADLERTIEATLGARKRKLVKVISLQNLITELCVGQAAAVIFALQS